MKDETHIKVRMFDEDPADSELEDIVNADYKKMLMKKAICSYCGTEPATDICYWGPNTEFEYPMFTFPICDKHRGFHGLADTHRMDWTSVFIHNWKKQDRPKQEALSTQ